MSMLGLCPENIAVIGGGRWARVLTEALCGVVPSSVNISVHSLHNADFMSAWVMKKELGRQIQVYSDWPHFLSSAQSAVIVVNAARDHEKAIRWALSAGIPVLVEKPVTLTAAASQSLADLAFGKNIRFASAHVFLFARYVKNFANRVAELNSIRSIHVCWTDPKSEYRYGEKKRHDQGLPFFMDCLPHILSIVGTLIPALPRRCDKLVFKKGGSGLEIRIWFDDVPCNVYMERDGDERQRIIDVVADKEKLQLDFSKEPGTIISGKSIVNGDPDWDIKERPLAGMLMSFLKWVAGGEFDQRLDIKLGLQANRIIDQVCDIYQPAISNTTVNGD